MINSLIATYGPTILRGLILAIDAYADENTPFDHRQLKKEIKKHVANEAIGALKTIVEDTRNSEGHADASNNRSKEK